MLRKAVLVGLVALVALAALAGANESASAAPEGETFAFQAEVNRMMKLIIHSLYKNKEIFVRELISNASDALDKIRFLSLQNHDILGDTTDLRIQIQADKEHGLLHLTDTGIGMTRDDLIRNLGTIAKSGTADFIAALEQSDLNMIGQFGVGFYSAFLVADRVTVTSKHNDDKQYIWESTADADFVIREDPAGNTLGRGTRITLHMKEDAASFLEESTLKELVQKYSQFINYPIYLWTTRTETVIDEAEDEFPEETTDEAEGADQEAAAGEEEEERASSERVVTDFVQVNQNRPLWTRNPADITQDEYDDFYRAIAHTQDAPFAHTHFVAEGEVDFKALLFVPKRLPQAVFAAEEPDSLIKLFVRRVFITDELSDLLPRYLRFVTGLVDSDDLPLNVSRETLQQSKLLKVIKKKLTRKVLELIADISKDQERYEEFLGEFNIALKMGVVEDASNRKRLSKLLRFKTSKSDGAWRSLDDYVEAMKKKQQSIYFIAGESMDELRTSPFLERLQARDYEVIFMTDPIDEYLVQSLGEFDGKRFVNIAKDNLKFGDETDESLTLQAAIEARMGGLLTLMQTLLKDKIEKAKVSNRLTTSPVALVASQFGVSGNMERIMKAQAYGNPNDPMSSFYASQKKILEVNPKHPIIMEMFDRLENGKTEGLDEVVRILYDTAVLRSGYTLGSTADFAARIESMVRRNLNVPLDAQAEVNETPAEDRDADDQTTDEEAPADDAFTHEEL